MRWAAIDQLKIKSDMFKRDSLALEYAELVYVHYIPLGLHLDRRTFPVTEHWCFSHIRCSQQKPKSDRASQRRTGHSALEHLVVLGR